MKELIIGEWRVKVGERRRVPEDLIHWLEIFLSGKWKEAVIKDAKDTGMWWRGLREMGIPSPIIRVDMAPNNELDHQRKIYEIEVRPAGLGIALALLPEKSRDQWRRILKRNGCQGLVKLESSIQDDILAAKLLDLPYFEKPPSKKGFFWIRTKIDDHRATILEEKSLVPIRLDGYKGYLLKLNLASLVKEPSGLPWEKGFAIKPLQGSKMEGVELWLPQENPGISTKARILKRLEEKVPYLWQPFIFPEEEKQEEKKGWTIWRLYFGWENEKYTFIGGLWNWRPNLRIHGASDAIFGPIF